MSELHEVIIDSASLGPGFSSLLHGSGPRLSQLALSLQVFTSDNMKIISEECRNLKILHLFFTSFIQSSHDEHLYFSLKLEGQTKCLDFYPKLYSYFPQGLFLGVTKSCDVDRVHKCLTSHILVKSWNSVKCSNQSQCSPPAPAWGHCFCRGFLPSLTMSFLKPWSVETILSAGLNVLGLRVE